MCGICGIWGERAPQRIETMIAAMRHRGPDDQGSYYDNCISLGISRLSVLDLSPTGRQPMQTPDGMIWIVYNGEVYNFQSERNFLEAKGFSFASTSDTEVILRMYEHYGDEFVLRLNGMFALAIYDKRRGPGHERLILARDHLGIKPLLYSQIGNRLLFASEIKALLASGLVNPEVDPISLRMLLTYGSIIQPRTILREVNMLLPAHRMIVEHGKSRIERYWSLGIDRHKGVREMPYEAMVERMGRVLEDTIQLQMISDVPLGAFLSGGIDSSVLTAMMARLTGHRLKTFSVGFETEGAEIDESEKARSIAHYLGTDHNHILVRGSEVRDRIKHIAFSLDQPSVDGVNSYFISWAARKAVTVAISGTGGDEIFAGYPWFIWMILHQHRNKRGTWKAAAQSTLTSIAQWSIFDNFILKRGGARIFNIRESAAFTTKYATLYGIFGPVGAAKIMSQRFREMTDAGRSTKEDLDFIDELPDGSIIERVSGLCLRGYTNNQLLRDIDAVSMAHSLEVRVPYLDVSVIDLALSLPDAAKMGDLLKISSPTQKMYRETGAKRILIDVGRSLLPKDFDLQPKLGFGMPFASWLRGSLKEVLLDTLSDTSIHHRGWLDVRQVAKVRDDFLNGNVKGWAQPWLLMMLELWCREVLDQSPSGLIRGPGN